MPCLCSMNPSPKCQILSDGTVNAEREFCFYLHLLSSHRSTAWKIYLHWAAVLGFKLPNTRKGLRQQRGPKCVDLQCKIQLIKTQQKKALEKMIGMERKPFSKVPKVITTCTLTFSIFISSSRKEMPEQKLCRKKTGSDKEFS